MAATIGSNVSSLAAQRALSRTSLSLASTFERLASGQRINRASDDAAGLSQVSSLDSRSLVFKQGLRNFNDGVSLLNIASGAISSLTDIVMRLNELAEQSANGVLGLQQRRSIDQEAQSLADEFSRIASSTTFNAVHVLDGSLGELRLQAGYTTNGSIATGVGGAIGTGGFNAGTSFSTEDFASYAMALGDLNGDGNIDLVTAGRLAVNDGQVTAQLGLGDGTFGAASRYVNEDDASYAVALGDVNGDGTLDMVTAGATDIFDGYAFVRLGVGDGTFRAASSYKTEPFISTGVTLGDLNGDGKADLITVGYDGANGWSTIRVGNGDGSFRASISYMTDSGGATTAVAVGDLNGDDLLDLVTTGYGAPAVRLGRGDGTFGASTSYVAETDASLAVKLGDLDGDGKLDLVTAGMSGTDGYVTIRLGRGDGTFGAASSYETESYSSNGLALGDLNGDAMLDLATTGTSDYGPAATTIRLGRGNGTFGAATSYDCGPATAWAVGLGDLNRDGVLDVVSASAAGSGRAAVHLAITKEGVAPLLPFDLTTMAGARQALPVFQQKLDQLTIQQGQIGAFQSRLSSALRVASVAVDTIAAAASRIRDADIAQESATMLRLQILQQSEIAILGQANQQPALVMQLLK